MLDPRQIDASDYGYAAMLDGVERQGGYVTLEDIIRQGKSERWRISLMVTGTAAISLRGVRFGKGHWFFRSRMGDSVRAGRSTVCDVVVTPIRGLDDL
jgi:5-formyltetrahydrofolate cyclo-ligase